MTVGSGRLGFESRWNVVRGAAMAIGAVTVPVAGRVALSDREYAQLILAATIAPWMIAAQAGLAVGLVARAAAAGEDVPRLALLGRQGTRLSLQLSAGGLAVIAVAGLGARAAGAFTDAADLVSAAVPAVAAAVVLAVSTALAAARVAIAIGPGRVRPAAEAAIGGLAVQMAATVVWVACHPWLPAPLRSSSVPLLCAALSSLVAWRLLRPNRALAPVPDAHAARSVNAELLHHVKAQAFWVVPALAVSGLDNFFVTEFEPLTLPSYSIALTMLTVGAGLIGSVTVPLVSAVVRLSDSPRASSAAIRWASIRAVVLCVCIAAGVPASLATLQQIGLVDTAGASVLILSVAHALRLLTSPLAAYAVATGQQRRLYVAPLGEMVAGVTFSVLLGRNYGAAGVACGTLIGSAVSVAWHGTAVRGTLGRQSFDAAMWNRYVLLPGSGLLALAGALIVFAT